MPIWYSGLFAILTPDYLYNNFKRIKEEIAAYSKHNASGNRADQF